jgi:hypothetical protein
MLLEYKSNKIREYSSTNGKEITNTNTKSGCVLKKSSSKLKIKPDIPHFNKDPRTPKNDSPKCDTKEKSLNEIFFSEPFGESNRLPSHEMFFIAKQKNVESLHNHNVPHTSGKSTENLDAEFEEYWLSSKSCVKLHERTISFPLIEANINFDFSNLELPTGVDPSLGIHHCH